LDCGNALSRIVGSASLEKPGRANIARGRARSHYTRRRFAAALLQLPAHDLHLLLWTLRLAEIYSAPLREEIRARARSAYDFLRQWVDPISGLVPNYGSDDGSLILPLASASYRDFRPLLQLGAAVLNRPALQKGPWDEPALWFGVHPAPCRQQLRLPSAETGYFRLGDRNSWALIRAGRYSRRPFQADQLHVDLWWQGINLARDLERISTTDRRRWNNGFARTAAITLSPSIIKTRCAAPTDFSGSTGRKLRAMPIHRAIRRARPFAGEHDGYRRVGVTHRRAVQWLHGSGWIIVDDILHGHIERQ